MKKRGESLTTAATDPVAGKTVAEILGEIAWLMTQDPEHAGASINKLETHVMPGIVLRQLHIQYAEIPSPPASGNMNPNLQPVSVEIWAMVSEAVAARLNADPAASIGIAEWRSGSIRQSVFCATLPGFRPTENQK
ncbi:toxin-activating lysine-acyltransferase [Paracoccus methylarcula]|uniref:RTX toxin-activating lysine-acyltransferase n=1 Tax=Paracoccus methylarcula TaxID=72022 RepID=A0A422QZF1_9RHOB|nr:toxin-activating lysine-acyltransferase [Paracoccus methylarcula]RNF35375.1 toxin-activating lysine-acyltransferase [Paracoccus methylarcula]